MAGLGRILKIFGKIETTDNKGNSVVWVWDYAKNLARKENEMTKEQQIESDKAKFNQLRK